MMTSVDCPALIAKAREGRKVAMDQIYSSRRFRPTAWLPAHGRRPALRTSGILLVSAAIVGRAPRGSSANIAALGVGAGARWCVVGASDRRPRTCRPSTSPLPSGVAAARSLTASCRIWLVVTRRVHAGISGAQGLSCGPARRRLSRTNSGAADVSARGDGQRRTIRNRGHCDRATDVDAVHRRSATAPVGVTSVRVARLTSVQHRCGPSAAAWS